MWIKISTYLGLLATFFSGTATTVRNCDEGEYFKTSSNNCVKCSQCPINKIIRRTCSGFDDTECGAFVEFDPIHFGIKNNHLKHVSISNSGVDESNKKDNSNSNSNGVTYVFTNDSENQVEYQSNKHGDQWRTLALSLIGVLSVVCLFLVIFIVVACQLRRRQTRDKTILCDPEARSSSHTRLKRSHRDHDRMVPSVRNPGDGSHRAGSDRFRVPAIIRPESISSDFEQDSDLQAETSSHVPSTDYVYFRAPINGNDVAA